MNTISDAHMVEMTIQVPESMAERITAVETRLPEVLARGLNELSPVPNSIYSYILTFLIDQPSAQELLDFGPTEDMQSRASALLRKNRTGELTVSENKELDEYTRINRLVTMLKARAIPYLAPTG